MAQDPSGSTKEIETVKKIYAALNRNDVTSYLEHFDANVDRFESFGSRHRGLEGLKDNFKQGRNTWAEGGCEPEKFIVAGNKVVVFVHVRVRQKEKTEWIDGHVTDVFTFRNERVIEFYSFADRNEALLWAGVSQDSIK